jgi:uncharacterized protein
MDRGESMTAETPLEFAGKYGPWALVAGASEGVGASVARLLGDRGINVALVSRRQAALDEVADSIATETRTIELDLSTRDADIRLTEATVDLEVGLLIYNAGADPFTSRFLDQPLESWAGLVRRNVDAVVGVCHRFGSAMARRRRGGIVLVTSGAAWAGGARLAAYGASKAFDLILGEALWSELKPLGVDVLSMVLGPTDTPAFRRVLNGKPFDGMADPDDVARHMLDNLAEGPTWPPGGSPFGPMPRRQAVELMTKASSFLDDDERQP